MSVSIRFLGAVGTVTGSRFFVRHGDGRTLVDCGLFQGPRAIKDRNREPFPVDPDDIHRIVLTHAHIDHTGFLPRLVRQGYRGPVWATAATCDLLQLLLPDAGHLQEEEARWHNKNRKKKRKTTEHDPAIPLFTENDARDALDLLRPMPYDEVQDIGEGHGLRFIRAGHILGSAMVEFRLPRSGPHSTLLFTGDLGRPGQPILKDPGIISHAGVLVMESTYGDREHGHDDPKAMLEKVIRETASRGGVTLIPSFAIGRTQLLLYLLHELQREKRIPDLPVFIDSPMAINAVPLYCRHTQEHDLTMRALTSDACPILLPNLRMMRSREQSKGLNDIRYPCIIISASGMATGGRIVHHLRHRLEDDRNSVVFVGYQAQGTRGRYLQDGAREIKIYGAKFKVRAQVHTLTGLSAHADVNEMLAWLAHFEIAPRQTFLVHGEPRASEALAETIRKRLRWNVTLPEDGQEVEVLQ